MTQLSYPHTWVTADLLYKANELARQHADWWCKATDTKPRGALKKGPKPKKDGKDVLGHLIDTMSRGEITKIQARDLYREHRINQLGSNVDGAAKQLEIIDADKNFSAKLKRMESKKREREVLLKKIYKKHPM